MPASGRNLWMCSRRGHPTTLAKEVRGLWRRWQTPAASGCHPTSSQTSKKVGPPGPPWSPATAQVHSLASQTRTFLSIPAWLRVWGFVGTRCYPKGEPHRLSSTEINHFRARVHSELCSCSYSRSEVSIAESRWYVRLPCVIVIEWLQPSYNLLTWGSTKL